MMNEDLQLDVSLAPDQALALAQFLKRVSFSQIRENAVDDDEAYLMRAALHQVRLSLGSEGYDPR
jgi:hypothetical protein